METITTYKQRIFGLDVVRALAIILIICSHATLLLFPDSQSTIIKTIQFFGTIGVDLFFVLSGFLIGTILIKHIAHNKTSIKDFINFWLRRWLRTLPNYYLVLIINIGLLFLFNLDAPNQLYKYFFFLQNLSQKQPDFFTESWSLTIEEFAYIIGPVCLILLGAIFKKVTKWMFLLTTLVIIASAIYHRFLFDNMASIAIQDFSWSKSLRKVVVYRIDSIYYGFIGAFFAFYYSSTWVRYKYISFIIGVLLFIGTHLLILFNQLNPDSFSTFFNVYYLSLLSISILLTFPMFSNWQSSQFLSKTITNISLWSYSIYLINYSIVLLSIQHFTKNLELTYVGKFGLLFLYLVITFVLSYLLFTFFEYPILKFRDSKRYKRWFEN